MEMLVELWMWLFLITEILFFSGLFTAYAVYRANHPEIFTYGHMFLNPTLGALNTIVLLFSSLTMAWAVRCAQLGQKQGLVILLAITWLCALTFLVVKYFEYSHKFHLGIYPAKYFVYGENPHGEITATGTAQPAAGAAAVGATDGASGGSGATAEAGCAGGIFWIISSAKLMNAWLPLAEGSKTTPGSP